MTIVLAMLMLIASVYPAYKMIKGKDINWLIFGIAGIFSIGYYVLPVFFKKSSNLLYVKEEILNECQIISLIFWLSILIGNILDKKFDFFSTKGVHLPMLDRLFYMHKGKFFFICYSCIILNYFTNDLTSYSASDFEEYFSKRSTLSVFFATISEFCLSIITLIIAISYKEKSRKVILYFVLYFIIILLLLALGQRLAVITPIFMLVGSFAIFSNYKLGLKVIQIGVIVLLVVSPLMVFFREFQDESGKAKAIEASKDYNSSSLISDGFISIMQRSDLLFVMTELKEKYDQRNDFDHSKYFESVFFSFVPRILYPEKPYPLSDNGKMSGETSIQAWILIMGPSTGSLSAFGSICAYREGGWVWVLINGLLTGFLLSFLTKSLAYGGLISKVIFISIFTVLCIKNVPQSFFYLIVALVPVFYMVLITRVSNVLLMLFNK